MLIDVRDLLRPSREIDQGIVTMGELIEGPNGHQLAQGIVRDRGFARFYKLAALMTR